GCARGALRPAGGRHASVGLSGRAHPALRACPAAARGAQRQRRLVSGRCARALRCPVGELGSPAGRPCSRSAASFRASGVRAALAMTTIFVSVQTGMAVRDLLRCGPLSRILSQPDAHVVLLTPGARDPAFLAEFGHERVSVVAQQPYAPSTMVWRLMNRRWRHARSPWLADALLRVEDRMVGVPPAYDELFRRYRPALAVIGDPLRPGDANLIAAAHRHGVPTLGSVRSWDNLQKHLRTRPDRLT